MKIATILTVFNRKQKTISCLQHLFQAQKAYNQAVDEPTKQLELTVFLTDDGCTDGTAEAVRNLFADHQVIIVQGTGSLYWAGGMRKAWQAAIDNGTHWDYFLLLNDDTNVHENVFPQLFETIERGFQLTGKQGIASGITCQPGDPQQITYGGYVFVTKAKGRFVPVLPNGEPQHIDLAHANILLVHHSVVESIGIFYKGFLHRGADWDYGMQAHSKGFPTLATPRVCGECECDHYSPKDEINMLRKMSLKERIAYVNSPIHTNHDYLLYVWRNLPLRFPLAALARTTRVYLPSLYYHVTNLRGIYKDIRKKE